MLRVVEERASTDAPAPSDPVEVVQLSYPSLLATARRLRSSRTEGEDLVQEALVETLSRHPEFSGIERPLGYLRTVLFHIAFRRHRARWTEVPLDLQERLEDPTRSPEDRIFAEELLHQLPSRQRACVALRYLYGLDDGEIALALGCAHSTVRSQIARGLATLRKQAQEVRDEN